MTVIKHVLTVISLIAVISSATFAQDPAHKKEGQSDDIDSDIRKLLEVTGSGNLGEQLLDQMFAALRASAKQVPEEVWHEIYTEFKRDFSSEALVEMLTPVYKKYLTQKDIKELIAFYETPVGKKMTSVLPKMSQESFIIGQERGKEIVRRLRERLKQKGYNTTAE